MPYFHQHALLPNLLHLCHCRPSARCSTFSCSAYHSSVMEHANERWTQWTNQCCSWFIIWWLLVPLPLFSSRLYLPAQWSDIVLIHVVMMYRLWWSFLALSPNLHQMPVASRWCWRHKACGMHNIIIGCRILHRSCSKPTQMIGNHHTGLTSLQKHDDCHVLSYL